MKIRLSDEEVKLAVHKIARTPDGYILFAALQSVLEEIGPVETCALHAHNERRKFASDLIAMAEAEKRDGSENDGTERRHGQRAASTQKSRRAGPAGRG